MCLSSSPYSFSLSLSFTLRKKYSSSFSATSRKKKYDVFLSFRTEDTGDNFTSHLYYALRREKIETFIDDNLEKGEKILPGLLKAIEESKISIIIFSKNYASSEWCLEELVKILECRKNHGQIVIPVFYQVAPVDVRNQTGSFKDVFINHEKEFKHTTEKLQRWKDALRETCNLCGWDSSLIRPEAKLVDEIVNDIQKKLKSMMSSRNFKVNSHVEQSKSSLYNIRLSKSQITGILSMDYEAETVTVEKKQIFDQISYQYERFSAYKKVRFHYSRRCKQFRTAKTFWRRARTIGK